MSSLLNIKNANNQSIAIDPSGSVPGNRFGDKNLEQFDSITEGFFYAYDTISFIRKFEIDAFFPNFLIDTLSIDQFEYTPINKIRVITGIFWDFYIKPEEQNRQIIIKKMIELIRITIEKLQSLKLSYIIDDLPPIESLSVDMCELQKYNNDVCIVLFHDLMYKSKREEFFTIKQYKEILCPRFELTFSIEQINHQRQEIPFLWKQINSKRWLFLSKIIRPPFSKLEILDRLFINDEKKDIPRRRFKAVEEIFNSCQMLPELHLTLPLKFRKSPQSTVFSTKKYQKFVAEYMFHNNGLLCWHDAGTGKTLTSIMTIIAFLKRTPSGKVIIVCPASLKQQWEEVIREHIVPSDTNDKFMDKWEKCIQLQDRIRVISYNTLNDGMIERVVNTAGNLSKSYQHRQTQKTSNAIEFLRFVYEKQDSKIMGVFDEIHEVSKEFVQSKKPTAYLYSIMPEMKNVASVEQPTGAYWLRMFIATLLDKAIFLTATPIQNSITDLRPILQNIVIVNHEKSSMERVKTLFWEDGFKKKWQQVIVSSSKKQNVSTRLTNKMFEDNPVIPSMYSPNNSIFSNNSLMTSNISNRICVLAVLNMIANWRGVIHRIRAIVPGRGMQMRQVNQDDNFPQEINHVHYLEVKKDSDFFKQYQNLIQKNVVSRDLKQYRLMIEEDRSFHESTALYSNQRESTSCIYQIKKQDSKSLIFDRVDQIMISGKYNNPVITDSDETFTRVSLSSDDDFNRIRLFEEIIIDGHHFVIDKKTTPGKIEIRIPNKEFKDQRDLELFLKKRSDWTAHSKDIKSRAHPFSYRFPKLFVLDDNNLKKLRLRDDTQQKIKEIGILRSTDKKKTQERFSKIFIEKDDMIKIKNEFYNIVDIDDKSITVDKDIVSKDIIHEIDIYKPFVTKVTNTPLQIDNNIIRVPKTSTTNKLFSVRMEKTGKIVIGDQSFPIKEITSENKWYKIRTDREVKYNKTPSEWSVSSFNITGASSISRIRPNLDKTRHKVIKEAELIIPSMTIIDKHTISIAKKEADPVLKTRFDDRMIIRINGVDYRVQHIDEIGDFYIIHLIDEIEKSERNDRVQFIFMDPRFICSAKMDYLRGISHDTNGEKLRLWGSQKKVVIFTAFIANMSTLAYLMKKPNFFVDKSERDANPLVLSIETDDPNKRTMIVQRFKSEKGNVVMIITKKAATGIDLTGVTDIVFYDLVWTASLYTQITGRGIRFRSHTNLEISRRKVNIHVLLLCAPKDSGIQFVDQILWNKIQQKDKIHNNLDRFMLWDRYSLRDNNELTLVNTEDPFGEERIGGLLLNAPPIMKSWQEFRSITHKRKKKLEQQQQNEPVRKK